MIISVYYSYKVMNESFCILLCMCGSKSSKANVYFILKFEVVTFQGLDSHIWLVLCIGQ